MPTPRDENPDCKSRALSTRLLHWTMILLVLSVVFAGSGALAFILPYNRHTARFVIDESPAAAWLRFGAGGVIGVAATIRWYHGDIYPANRRGKSNRG